MFESVGSMSPEPPTIRRASRRLLMLVLLALILSSVPSWAEGTKAEQVRLRLKWRHQFQFAGYYAALHKGFYRDAGLDVIIQEAANQITPVDSVLKGQSDFGVYGTELVRYRAAGMPVVAVAAIFQHSPAAIVGRKDRGISQITDIAGKRIYMEPDAADLLALLKINGIESSHFTNPFDPSIHDYTVDNLIQGGVDGMYVYLNNDLYSLNKAGVPCSVFSPRDAGIDFYADVLFTTEKTLADRPRVVKAFRDASIKGWQYAMAHQAEIIQLILDRYTVRHSSEHLQFEAAQMRPLLEPDVVEIGYMSRTRWQTIVDTYRRLDLLKGDVDLDKFIFYPVDRVNVARFWKETILALIVAGLALLLMFRYLHLARSLKRENQEREKIIQQLQTALAQIKTLSGLLPICSSCKKIRDDRGYWNQVEVYIRDRSDAHFTHGICPDCAQKLYPDFYPDKES